MSEQMLLEKESAEVNAAEITDVSSDTPAEKPTEPVSVTKTQKNYGVELLRIASMLFIIVLHVINFGGISFYHSGIYFPITAENIMHYKVANGMLAFCYCAVNCYALISGYVSCKSKFKLSKMISLWLTVVAINAAMYGLAYAYNPEWVAPYSIKSIFTPLTSDQYWYFTAYMGLLVLMPALNAAVNNIPKKHYGYMLAGMFLFFSVIPGLCGQDLFKEGAGYSLIWLVLLYLTGAYFKLHFKPEKWLWLVRTVSLAVYILSALALAFGRFIREERLSASSDGYVLYANDYSYTSVYVVICSIALFVLFININIKNKVVGRIIGFVSGTTFGIYLIHLNYIVMDRIITGRYVDEAMKSPLDMTLGILLAAVIIFAICFVIEKVRQLLFKYLFIDKLISLADKIHINK